DRDRLRQAVLEGLGWRIHRVWSTDWFHSPESELRRLLDAISAANAHIDPSSPAPVEAPPEGTAGPPLHPSAVAPENPTAPAIEPYRVAEPPVVLGNSELHEVGRAQVATWVEAVVQVEGPVHTTEVARRIAEAAGVKRIGHRIQGVLDA